MQIRSKPLKAAARFFGFRSATLHEGPKNRKKRGVMVGYELGVAAGGTVLAFGLANWWNPAGWVTVAAPIAYTLVTYGIGSIMQGSFENN